jgi:hypothetical protein
MNTKNFLRLGVPLGEATRRATDFVAIFILGGGDKSPLHEEVAAIVLDLPWLAPLASRPIWRNKGRNE